MIIVFSTIIFFSYSFSKLVASRDKIEMFTKINKI